LFIDIQTLIIVVLSTFIVGVMAGARLTRPRYGR